MEAVTKMSEQKRQAIGALGYYIANLDHTLSAEEEKVIHDYLAKTGLKLDLCALRKYDTNSISFESVSKRYLKHVSNKELKDINQYITLIILADHIISPEEKRFLEKDWIPYLKSRQGKNNHVDYKTIERFLLGDTKDPYTKIMAVSGFSAAECATLLDKTGWKSDQAAQNLKNLMTGAVTATEKEVITEGIRQAGLYQRLADNLAKLNTLRGGEKGFKGFVAEEMQATEASLQGTSTVTLNDNGVADLVRTGKNGHKYYQQMKMGYKPGQIDFSKYKGQTVIVDKGNPYLKQFQVEGKKYGVKVVEGNVTNQEAKNLADAMQFETKLTGQKTSTIVTSVTKAKGVFNAADNVGRKTAKSGALFGAGMSLGSNALDVLHGDKTVGEAAGDVAVDTVVSGAVGYGVGFAGTAIGSTTAGAAAIGAVESAGAAVAGTTVGGAVVGAAATATSAVGAAGASAVGAAVGAVGTVGSAIGGAAVAATAGTAVGGAVATGVGMATVGAAAVGAAAVAAAPVVAVGAAVGMGVKLISWLFD